MLIVWGVETGHALCLHHGRYFTMGNSSETVIRHEWKLTTIRISTMTKKLSFSTKQLITREMNSITL